MIFERIETSDRHEIMERVCMREGCTILLCIGQAQTCKDVQIICTPSVSAGSLLVVPFLEIA